MVSPLFGVEALAREPGFGERPTPQEEPDRLVRAVRPDVVDRLTVEALPTRDERARTASPDDVAAA
jgi:hypothetical protein